MSQFKCQLSTLPRQLQPDQTRPEADICGSRRRDSAGVELMRYMASHATCVSWVKMAEVSLWSSTRSSIPFHAAISTHGSIQKRRRVNRRMSIYLTFMAAIHAAKVPRKFFGCPTFIPSFGVVSVTCGLNILSANGREISSAYGAFLKPGNSGLVTTRRTFTPSSVPCLPARLTVSTS